MGNINNLEVRPDGHVTMYRAYARWPKPEGDGRWRAEGGTYGSEVDAQNYIDTHLRLVMGGAEFQVRSHRGMKLSAYTG